MDPLGVQFGKNLYSLLANGSMSSIDLLGLNAVIVSGGINTNTYNDNHDKNWRNFTDAAKIKFGIIRDYCNEEKEWFVNKTSYILREKHEDEKRSNHMHIMWGYSENPIIYSFVKTHEETVSRNGYQKYIKEIERTAKELGVTLRWYSSKTEFLNLLATQPNGKRRTGCSKIAQFVYYGHGSIGELWITYGGGGNINKEIVTAKEFPEGIFQFHPVIQLYSCHSASKKKNSTQKSIAEEIYDELMKKSLSVVVVGFNGRVDYVPVAEGKHPTGGTSVLREAVIEEPVYEKKGDHKNYYYHKEIKPTIYGS